MITNTIIGLMTLGILLYNEFPTKTSSIILHKLQRILHCNSAVHFNFLIFLTMLLQIACLYRAYQCRNLPGYLGEATTMLYASFVTTISFSVMFPIHYFQKNELDASLVHCIVLCGNNLATLVLMYGYKVYVVVFHPRVNTQKYLSEMRMQQMRKDAGLQSSMRISSSCGKTFDE